MSTEIYNNFQVRRADHIDGRLKTVSTYGSLPDPTLVANFLYVGASVYVEDVDQYYKLDSSNSWSTTESAALTVGSITITSATSLLDLSLVSPSIAKCHSVVINLSGTGTSANITSISNFPTTAGKEILFSTQLGKEINFKHVDYDSATSQQIVLEDGFDMLITGRQVGDDSVVFKNDAGVIVQSKATQFMKSSQWAQNLLSISIVDALNSTSSSSALSANQGRVLNSLFDFKEDKFVKGAGLAFNTSTKTLTTVPSKWEKTNNPISSIDLSTVGSFETWLVSLYSTISIDTFRHVEANNGINNRGVWMIPPTKDPSVSGNWVMLSGGNPITAAQEFSIFPQALPGNHLVAQKFHPAVEITTSVGDSNYGLITNSDGSSTEKVSLGFSNIGLYKVDASIILNGTDQPSLSAISSAVLSLITTQGVQPAANPANTGVVHSKEAYVSASFALQGAIGVKATVSALLNVTAVDLNNAFTFTVAKTDGSSIVWTNVTIDGSSKLNITKLR